MFENKKIPASQKKVIKDFLEKSRLVMMKFCPFLNFRVEVDSAESSGVSTHSHTAVSMNTWRSWLELPLLLCDLARRRVRGAPHLRFSNYFDY
jgi:hypothetical protein